MPPSSPRTVLTVRAPETVRKRLVALVAAGRYANRSAAHLALLERGLESVVPSHVPGGSGAPGVGKKVRRERLERLFFRASPEVAGRLRAHAVRHGHASASEAIAAFVTQGLDYEEGRRVVPAQKADEVLDALGALGVLVDRMGPGVLGMLHLLAHWAVKSGSLKVSENDLLAEVHAVGESQWRQLLEEDADEASGGADAVRTH